MVGNKDALLLDIIILCVTSYCGFIEGVQLYAGKVSEWTRQPHIRTENETFLFILYYSLNLDNVVCAWLRAAPRGGLSDATRSR